MLQPPRIIPHIMLKQLFKANRQIPCRKAKNRPCLFKRGQRKAGIFSTPACHHPVYVNIKPASLFNL